MSDVRIERVEPCGEHGDDCYSGVQRKVLDGFPPEAVEAALQEWREHPPSTPVHVRLEAALAAAWAVLVGEVSE